jgi:bifunctional ADP-heptose synthase (sugar kinase/adenylyltransferase)
MEGSSAFHTTVAPPTILVVGDVIHDLYISGTVRGAATAPIFSGTSRLEALGGAANAAANLAALGSNVRLLGVVGADDPGGRRPTTQRTYLSADGRQVLRLDREGRTPLSGSMIARLAECADALLPEMDGVLIADSGKGVCSPLLIDPLLARAHSCNCPLFVDCASPAPERYGQATALIAHLDPLAEAEDRQVAAKALLEGNQAQALLLYCGQDGLSLYISPPSGMRSETPLHFSAQAGHAETIDPSWNGDGSGRAMIAVLCAGLLYGLSMTEAAQLAASAVEVAARGRGTAIVSWAELPGCPTPSHAR